MPTPKLTELQLAEIKEQYEKHSGNISAMSREMGLSRRTIVRRLANTEYSKRPLVGGGAGIVEQKSKWPAKGEVKRYICTSAQNNTHIELDFWNDLLALAEHYTAEILVGTFTYNQNNFGKLAVKRGKEPIKQRDLWYDPHVEPFINDKRVELGAGLVWCGEMNILPTAVDPLEALETYSHRKSAIFPHAKLAMRSIATMQGEGAKLNYTTGTVTVRNYIQKKEGLKAEHHHRFAALVVEVDHNGHWCVRQVGYSSKTREIQDLNILVKDGKIISKKATVEAITFGDLHATVADDTVVELSMDMLDVLKPKFTFLHDVLEGASINRHQIKEPNPHRAFHRWLRGYHRVGAELESTAALLRRYLRPYSQTIVPDSNHDGWWLKNWLAKFDYRVDPANAELFLKLQCYMYAEIRQGREPLEVNITERAFEEVGLHKSDIRFLLPDESFIICDRKIECGMHGHLGPNGQQGSPSNLNKIGRRANTAHTHSAGIWNGLYVAGTSSKLRWDYTFGPSSWTQSHVVTYSNGQRTIITMYAGKWRV